MTDVLIGTSPRERLHQLEKTIEDNLLAFVFVGNALIEVRERRLYETEKNPDTGESYRTFGEYMRGRWKPSVTHLYRFINATFIQNYLNENSPIGEFSPSHETQLRPLSKLASHNQVELGKKDPAIWLQAWQGAIKIAGNKEPTESQVARAVDIIIKANHRPKGIIAPAWVGDMALDCVYMADSTSLDFLQTLPENSIDMIFTDPPWDAESLVCYEAAGRLANRVLKLGSYLAIYCGKMFLPEILDILGKWLDYAWTMCVYQPDNNHSTSHQGVGIFEAWRPIAIYRKPGEKRECRFEPDALKCTRQKDWHDWQQGIEPIKKYIGQLTDPGEIILDPFIGGGTIMVAARILGRHYLGFDRDEEAVKNTIVRLSQ
jgi:site-specific DNA-methyltransferase (adenine-specific)